MQCRVGQAIMLRDKTPNLFLNMGRQSFTATKSRAEIRDFFYTAVGEVFECKVCGLRSNPGKTNHGHVRTHILKCLTPSKPEAPLQTELDDLHSSCSVDQGRISLIKLFTLPSIALCIVESSEFKNFVHHLRPDYHLPSRRQLVREIKAQAQVARSRSGRPLVLTRGK